MHFDWIEPARQLRVEIDQDRARRLGLTSAQLSSVLNTAVSGATVTQLRDDIYLVNVVARAADGSRVSLDTLATLQVPVPGGRTVALSQFANFSLRSGTALRLATRPAADADGAGRCGAGRYARGRRGRAGAADCGR